MDKRVLDHPDLIELGRREARRLNLDLAQIDQVGIEQLGSRMRVRRFVAAAVAVAGLSVGAVVGVQALGSHYDQKYDGCPPDQTDQTINPRTEDTPPLLDPIAAAELGCDKI